jgi:type IV pilus assembly protein PilF
MTSLPGCLRWAGACLVLAAALAGCTTTVTQSQVKGEARDVAPPTDDMSATRRAGVRLELASLYFSRGQMNTALEEIKRAIDAKPDYGAAYNLRGLIYAGLGNTQQAEESFQRALQIDPRDADAMQNYGWFLCQNQRYTQAEELFQRALNQPNYRGSAMTLRAQGNCQARDGRLADAERSLARSYELDPSSAATAVNLAEVQYRRGEYERARFYIDRVNNKPEQTNAQSLWLAARIENRLGNQATVRGLGDQLRARYPLSPETLAYEQRRFDE